jgi:hypothetical protein
MQFAADGTRYTGGIRSSGLHGGADCGRARILVPENMTQERHDARPQTTTSCTEGNLKQSFRVGPQLRLIGNCLGDFLLRCAEIVLGCSRFRTL